MDDKYDKLRRIAAELLESEPLQPPKPEFRFRVGWFGNYDKLLQMKPDESTDLEVLASQVLETGRVMLSARGGGAKTVVIHEVARLLLERNALPILVDLKQWTPAHYRRWSDLPDIATRLNYLLTQFAVPQATTSLLDSLSPDIDRIVLIDGLNEVMSETGRQILDAVDDLVRYAVRTGVIVADRLVRRDLRPASQWQLASIMPLDAQEIQRILKENAQASYDEMDEPERELLSTPYFLNSRLGGNAGKTSSEIIRHYFREHVSLSDEEILTAGAAAFQMYSEFQSRTFQLAAFAKRIPQNVLDALVASKALLISQDEAFFAHHLKHDFLASCHIATFKDLWTTDVFNVATFKASSFDILAMVFQQLETPEDADFLFEIVYDWSLYGAAYSVTEGRRHEADTLCITTEMEYIILAMLAIRRWDIFQGTRTKSEDALSLFFTEPAKAFQTATSRDDVRDIIAKVDTPKASFNEWRDLFLAADAIELNNDLLASIQDKRSIRGWTLSNMLRDLDLSPAQVDYLIEILFASGNYVVRWRIVHVLGSCLNDRSTGALFEALFHDPSEWVRYGAARSLMEIAVRDSGLRSDIMEGLRKNAAQLLADPPALREIRSCLFVAKEFAPKDWLAAIMPLVEEFYVREANFDARADWERAGIALQGRYHGLEEG